MSRNTTVDPIFEVHSPRELDTASAMLAGGPPIIARVVSPDPHGGGTQKEY